MQSKKLRTTGSPSIGEPASLAIGRIRRSHGVKGEMLVEVLTDFPERLHSGTVVYIGKKQIPWTVQTCRSHKDGLLVSFEEINSPEQASLFRNQIIHIPSKNSKVLPEGEYYHHQIVGLNVFNEKNQKLGILTEIIETGANDVYVVKPQMGNEILIPVISETILDIDLNLQTMHVHLLPGLTDSEEA